MRRRSHPQAGSYILLEYLTSVSFFLYLNRGEGRSSRIVKKFTGPDDEMESFLFAEPFKYFYLLSRLRSRLAAGAYARNRARAAGSPSENRPSRTTRFVLSVK